MTPTESTIMNLPEQPAPKENLVTLKLGGQHLFFGGLALGALIALVVVFLA